MTGLERLFARVRSRIGDEGVSVIVGAILITGIMLSAIVTVRLTFVPVWEEKAEAQHMEAVSRAMSELASETNRRIDNSSRAPVSVNIPMVAESGQTIFSTSRSPGALSFTDSQAPVRVSTPSMLLQVRNGTDLAGVNETWDTIGSSDEVRDATQVLNLRMNITGPPCQGTVRNCFDNGDNVRATITDSRGDFAGDLTAYMDRPKDSSTAFIKIQVRTPTKTVVFNNSVHSFQHTDWNPPYWVNTLNGDYRFDRLLDAARAPYDIRLTENGLDGTFSATYAQDVSGSGGAGTIIVGGGGILEGNFQRLFTGGSLSYESDNLHYPAQAYVIENGALILEQSDGATFKIDPPIEISAGGGAAIVGLGVPALQGESTSFTGSRTTAVRLSTTSSQGAVGSAGSFNITFHTAYPDLWETFLEEELARAGLTTAQDCDPPSVDGDDVDNDCRYALTTTSSKVDLMLLGPTAVDSFKDPATRDLSISYTQGSITTEIRT